MAGEPVDSMCRDQSALHKVGSCPPISFRSDCLVNRKKASARTGFPPHKLEIGLPEISKHLQHYLTTSRLRLFHLTNRHTTTNQPQVPPQLRRATAECSGIFACDLYQAAWGRW